MSKTGCGLWLFESQSVNILLIIFDPVGQFQFRIRLLNSIAYGTNYVLKLLC